MPITRLVPPKEWPTLGWQVIDWIEDYLCHGPGDIEGDDLELDDEFSEFIVDCYRLYPRGHELAGRRVVTEAELSRAKGRAKSELAGAMVCAEFVGPVRFDGWDAAGEPVGRPLRYPFIRCLATEEGQSGNTYDNVRSMLTHGIDKHPDVFAGIDVGLTRTFLHRPGGGEIRPSSAAASSKDGGKETFTVADEVHLYVLPELRSMYRTVAKNTRKRKAAQGWMLSTTTQFEPGQESVAELHRRDAENQIANPKKRRWSFLWDHREGHEVADDDWDDDALLMASLSEAYGEASEWMDLRSILADDIRAEGVPKSEVERFWLNRRSSSDGKAIKADDWDAMADPERVVPDGSYVVLGFDGSKLDEVAAKYPDHTALVAWVLSQDQPPHLIELGLFDPLSDDRDGLRRLVRGAVHDAFARFNVLRMVCDPPHWRDEIDAWSEQYGEDIVITLDTMSGARMGPAVERMTQEAAPLRAFTHDGSSLLRRHALNAVLVRSHRGKWLALAKPKETEKIDGLVAAVIAWDELPNVEIPTPAETPAAVWV
jgi:hypothetical protein